MTIVQTLSSEMGKVIEKRHEMILAHEKFWDDIKEENQFAIMEHLVKMPLWTYLLAKSNSTNDRWKVMNMLYNDEIGGTFEDNINKRLESKYEVLFA